MTTPFDPATPEADTSGTPTEPAPTFAAPQSAPSPSAPAGAPGGPALEPPPSATFVAAPVSASVATPARVQAPKRSGGPSRLLNVLLGAAVLVAAVGVAFAIGRSTAPTTTAAAAAANGGRFFTNGAGPGGSFDPNGFRGGAGNGTGRFGFSGAPTIQGTVESVTADSITIKSASGTTVTIGLDGSTTYHQQAAAAAADVTTGKTVIVQLSGELRPGANGNGNGNDNGNANGGTGTGTLSLGAASDVTVVP